ncbi:helix-turn-helix transcriptional regulator [Bacillus sp. RO3]|nr:helix-turn-helix transcriptional regulator [Bacillus sp. RO3]
MANNKLKSQRQKMKVKQQEAAQRLGISYPYYKQLELGKCTPGLQLAIKIQKEFLVEVMLWEK